MFIFLLSTLLVIRGISAVPLGDSESHNTIAEQASGIVHSAKDLTLNLLVPLEKTREDAKLEKEDLPSRISSVYDNSQKKAADFINPKPIIDTISEEEKYGNSGELFGGVSRAIVNGYEAFSNFMNKLIDAPGKLFQSVARSVNEKLDTVGGKLVGLA